MKYLFGAAILASVAVDSVVALPHLVIPAKPIRGLAYRQLANGTGASSSAAPSACQSVSGSAAPSAVPQVTGTTAAPVTGTSQASGTPQSSRTPAVSGTPAVCGTPAVSGTPASSAPKASGTAGSSRICGQSGYDKLNPLSYWVSQSAADITLAGCNALCQSKSTCLSFAVGQQTCLLYNASLAANFNPVADSPYKFYDLSCVSAASSAPVPAASSTVAATSSAAATSAAATSSAATSAAATSAVVSPSSSAAARPSSAPTSAAAPSVSSVPATSVPTTAKPTATSPTSTQPTGAITTPEPFQPGMVSNCDEFYFVKSGDYCQKIADQYGITLTQFITWNTQVGGTSCTTLWANNYVCVSINGDVAVPPATPTTTKAPAVTKTPAATTTAANGVATPSPVQTGITNSCKTFHFVASGENCSVISSKYGISLADFLKWNPAAKSDCSGLWANTYACIAVL